MQPSKVVSALFGILASAAVATAQSADTGSLRGRVTDGTGAALPGVTVSAISPAVMGGSLTAISSEEGIYRFPALPPGDYEIRFELSGFRTISIPDLRVNVGLGLTLDRQLEVAAIQESVTVVGESPIEPTATRWRTSSVRSPT